MIKLVHVLILIIVAFMLYHLSRCNYYNGFSVGSQVVNECRQWDGNRGKCHAYGKSGRCVYINGGICKNYCSQWDGYREDCPAECAYVNGNCIFKRDINCSSTYL